MRGRVRLVSLLWRWHRRLGLSVFLLVMVLAVSGIALNHTSGLGLDHWQVSSPLVRALYGVETVPAQGYQLGEHWLSRPDDETLYFDDHPVAACRGALVGAAIASGMIHAACAEELLLLTPQGELIEALGASSGLPVPLQGLATAAGQVELRAAGQWYRADFDAMAFTAAAGTAAERLQIALAAVPRALADQLPDGVRWLTWERVLLDLHSGRLGGWLGLAIVDGLGVILCVLGFSGFAMWWFHHRRR
ncbi:PepSY domain-containing protein [Haliea sp. E17]|uniref:PepSY domain-containing protein n=1 Tax=Haliea sp. E17 TaxID=3401576 RepID=UPI003AAE9F09